MATHTRTEPPPDFEDRCVLCPHCGNDDTVPDFTTPRGRDCLNQNCGRSFTTPLPAGAGQPIDAVAVEVDPSDRNVAVSRPSMPGTFSDNRLDLPGGLSFDQWRDVGLGLQVTAKAINWWWGDWGLYGVHQFGDVAYQGMPDDIGEILGRGDEAIGQLMWVAREFPPSERRLSLSWTHHRAVLLGGLDRVERGRLLNRAIVEGWATRALTEAARARVDELAQDPPQMPAPLPSGAMPLAPSALRGEVMPAPMAGGAADVADRVEDNHDAPPMAGQVLGQPEREMEQLRALVREFVRYVASTLTRSRGVVLHQQTCRIGQWIDGYGSPDGAPCSVACSQARTLVETGRILTGAA